MFDTFLQNLRSRIPIGASEEAFIRARLNRRLLRRNHYFLQQGDICKEMAFVNKGMLRLYSLDSKGREHTIQFAPEGWIISDLISLMSEQPSEYWIDALEDSELICMSMQDREEILQHIPNFQVFTRQQLTGAYAAMQQRITMLISASPDEKYEYFLARFGDIARRAPQYMVASYLGMIPETLSRVRKRRS